MSWPGIYVCATLNADAAITNLFQPARKSNEFLIIETCAPTARRLRSRCKVARSVTTKAARLLLRTSGTVHEQTLTKEENGDATGGS
jgi:hypothetical protein